MTYLLYIRLNDDTRERVDPDTVDAFEQAGVIDRTLLPVAGGARGWALNRKSGYFVEGDVGSKRASLVLLDDSVPIAVLGVCLHSRASAPLWAWLHQSAGKPVLSEPPAAPWVALRSDVPDTALPDWIDWWAKHVGCALMNREGW